ncbi:MAG: GGDEF domain-containing protein [Pseudomonadota bacterium]|nr:GGDEF domain-containing protein [Pseudomonadota bacterium]
MFKNTHDTPEKANRIFERVVDSFQEQEINPTPLNYFVWYNYLKGDNPPFRKEMDSILNDPYGYSDRVGKRLYEQFLLEDTEDSSEFDRAFRRLVGMMVKKMNAWSDKLEDHTQKLDECAVSLADPDLNSDEIKRISHTMVSTAQSMNESSKAFQQEMMESSDEVRRLRDQLIEAQNEALTDELTEVGNRKAFNNAIQEQILATDETDTPNTLCLILSDIDFFKKFNDTYGHLVGDSVLRYYANIMKKKQGENETICRYGGEEFAILMANTTLEKAKQRAEQIRIDIASATLKRKNSNEPLTTITASFGIAHYHGETEDSDSFIARADKALYQAKKTGRNKVVDELDLPQTDIN